MNSIIGALGEALSGAFAKAKSLVLRKDSVLEGIDGALELLRGVVAALGPSNAPADVRAGLGRTVDVPRPGHPIDVALKTLYRTYLHNLDRGAEQAERRVFLNAAVMAIEAMVADMELLAKHFTTVFDGTSKTAQTVEQTRIAQTMAMGQIALARSLGLWVSYFVYHLELPSGSHPPPYQMKYLNENAAMVAEVINAMLARPRGVSILTEIERVKRDGTDVYLMANGMPLSSFARDDEYTADGRLALRGFGMNPLIWWGDRAAIEQRRRYDAAKAMRSWLETKVQLAALDQRGLDPESPEYKKLEKALQYYTAEIARIDQELSRYGA